MSDSIVRWKVDDSSSRESENQLTVTDGEHRRQPVSPLYDNSQFVSCYYAFDNCSSPLLTLSTAEPDVNEARVSSVFSSGIDEVPNGTSIETVPVVQLATADLESVPFFAPMANIIKNSLSQHVRIEALSTTVTFCKAYYGSGINIPQKMFCAFSGAFNLMGTLSLTTAIEKQLGPVAETIFDLSTIGSVFALSIYAPTQYVNKFSQTSLFKGVLSGQLIREGLTYIFGPVQAAATALNLASNDLIVSLVSVGGSNYVAHEIAGGYGDSFFDMAQTTYRMLDIPMNYLLTLTTNACGFMVNGLLTLGAFAARVKTLDFAPNKVPAEILGIATGLLFGAAIFRSLPWIWSDEEDTLKSVTDIPSETLVNGKASEFDDLDFDL